MIPGRWFPWFLVLLLALPAGADPGAGSGTFEQRLERIREQIWRGDPAAARAEIEQVRQLLPVADAPFAAVHLDVIEAQLLWRQGRLAAADLLLQRPLGIPGADPRQADVASRAPPELRADYLFARGAIAYELGQYRRARRDFEERASLNRELGDAYHEASDRYNAAATLVAESVGDEHRETAISRFQELLDDNANPDLEVNLHLELGKLRGGTAGRRHLERCVELAAAPEDVVDCLGALAVARLGEDPAAARRLLDRAVARAERELREHGNSWPMIHLWADRMPVSWATLPPPQAIDDSLAALRHIEVLRRQQEDGTVRARFFSVWTEAYHWLAGRLLQPPGDARSRQHLELAFAVTERYRARVLFDSLEAAGAAPAAPAEAPGGDGASDPQEDALRDQLLHTRPAFPGLGDPRFATLAEIESSLADDEALLSFQIAPGTDIYRRFAGGSWLIAASAQGTRAYRLPEPAGLRHQIETYLGLFGHRDDSIARPAARLYRDLLKAALDDLPPAVDKLILVPDGVLHLLPLGTLRATPEDPPLAVRYQVSRVPSATLWRRWRRGGSPAPASALVLANPWLTLGGGAAPRAAVLRTSPLGPLPYAEEEGRAVVEKVGRASQLRIGVDATKDRLTPRDLEPFGLIHFAAHTVIDHVHPELSAVKLAAGGDGGDGDLRSREIVELDLEDRLIVLSTCGSASGDVVRGEGVMSLARAFFQAGATTLVGTLWPMRDQEAQLLFEELYRHLARGKSVQEALQLAQKARLEAGAPAETWAGVVVLGDGERVPIAGGRRPVLWAAIGVLAVVFLLGVWVRRRQEK